MITIKIVIGNSSSISFYTSVPGSITLALCSVSVPVYVCSSLVYTHTLLNTQHSVYIHPYNVDMFFS